MNENEEQKTIEPYVVKRDALGRILPGQKIPFLTGRPKDTPADKLNKKAVKEIVKEFREKLAEYLPRISPILVRKALKGDLTAIGQILDRTMGKAPQSTEFSGSLGLPFNIMIQKDGTNPEDYKNQTGEEKSEQGDSSHNKS